MADFALWATACETAIWPAGTFQGAYALNRDEAVDNVIEADPVGSAIRSMMTGRTEWSGTATELLSDLDEDVGEKITKSKNWPSSARALSGRVRRAATFLRKVGVDVSFEREGRARTRMIQIIRVPESGQQKASASSVPSASLFNRALHNDFDGYLTQTVREQTDTNSVEVKDTVLITGEENKAMDAADGRDGNVPDSSTGWSTR